jgi:hypothetical protein
MTMGMLTAAIGFGTGCLLLGANESKQVEPKQRVQVSNTQRVEFA